MPPHERASPQTSVIRTTILEQEIEKRLRNGAIPGQSSPVSMPRVVRFIYFADTSSFDRRYKLVTVHAG